MLPYIVLIATVCVLGLLCFNKLTKNHPPAALKIIYLSITFLFLFMYSVCRENIGYDYTMYVKGFSVMGNDGFSTLIYLDWEWGFTVLTKLVALFTQDVRIYMAVISVACLAGPFYLIYRYSQKVWLSVLLYVNLYFFYCTMNFLRQSIAISIVLFAYTFLVNRKFWKFALLILLATTFHATVLIMLPAYFMVNFKPSLRIPLLYAYLILWVFIASNATLDLITDYVHGEYRNSIFLTKGLDLIHTIIPTLFVGGGTFLVTKFIKPRNMADNEKIVVMQTNLMYFSYFWIAIMVRHAILERFSYYTYIFVILYIPELLVFADEKYKDYANRRFNAKIKENDLSETEQKGVIAYYKRTRRLFNIILVFLIVVITVSYNIYGLRSFPQFKGIYGGVHGVYPYTSWIDGLFN